MNIIQYRCRITSLAKNLKYSGAHFPKNIIDKIEYMINFVYNSDIIRNNFAKQKFDVIVKKHQLNVQNNQILFCQIIENTDMNALYRQLYDFLYKIDYIINVSNNKDELKQLFDLIEDQQFDNYSVIPMIKENNISEQYNNVVNNFLTQQKLLSYLIINEEKKAEIQDISSDAKNELEILSQHYQTQQIRQSDVKNLLD